MSRSMQESIAIAVAAALAANLLAEPASAQPKQRAAPAVADSDRATLPDPAFSEFDRRYTGVQFLPSERELIRTWYRRVRRNDFPARLGPGEESPGTDSRVAPFASGLRAKPAEAQLERSYRGAAPGLRHRLERGDRLPSGLARQYLPDELARQLPHRAGADRVVYGEDVYLIQRGTGLVLDVMLGALRD